MIDIEAIRTRARRGCTPPAMPPGLKETEAQARDREITNEWIREWAQDRRDLHKALDEIEILRKSTAPELLTLISKYLETRQRMEAIEREMVKVVPRG